MPKRANMKPYMLYYSMKKNMFLYRLQHSAAQAAEQAVVVTRLVARISSGTNVRCVAARCTAVVYMAHAQLFSSIIRTYPCNK